MRTENISDFLIDLLDLVYDDDLSLTELRNKLFQTIKVWCHLTGCSYLIEEPEDK